MSLRVVMMGTGDFAVPIMTTRNDIGFRSALIALFIAVHGSATEGCQNFVPGREVDPFDLLWNLLGGLLGGVTWFVASQRRESRSSQSYRPLL